MNEEENELNGVHVHVEDGKVTTEGIKDVLLAGLFVIINAIIGGEALSFGWNIFVLRIFNLPKVGVATVIGLATMVAFFQYKSDTPKVSNKELKRRAQDGIAVSLTFFFILIICSVF